MLESQYTTAFGAIAVLMGTSSFLLGEQAQQEGTWGKMTFGVHHIYPGALTFLKYSSLLLVWVHFLRIFFPCWGHLSLPDTFDD